jgi:hypothetical protein
MATRRIGGFRQEVIMIRIIAPIVYASASLLASSGTLSSQHHPEHHHGHHMAAPGYDLSTETTMECKVDSMEEVRASDCQGCEGGIHVRTTCGNEPYDVHLGPTAFVESKKFSLVKGDEIEVTGSRVSYDGGMSLIAKTVRKGESMLELRDAQGRPLWRKGR